ncbi:MmgE/PrpD family protein [Nioella ostreopsis]|uniref:MmgE/PrpD family protein n=1 Tax=Nioella ostreopsis TaxID=2448479 RepID=UPI000FD866BD|nr:MmgE/PrpD family protein [Nioella ostreopsis]
MTKTPFTDALASFAAAPLAGADTARAVLRLSLLDWCAVAIAGRQEPVAQVLRALAEEEGGTPQAHALGLDQRVPSRMAALVNGTLSHALDYDDTHFAHIGHPSVAVIPAALAMGERVGATGAAVQEAALVGVEASVRVGVWLGRGHYEAGFHQTATAGAFGAGLAAGRLLRLSAAQLADVIGLLGTRASGLKSQFGTMGKPFNAGIAAANGVEAALLVSKGFDPRRAGLEDAQGFGPTHHGSGDMSALDGLGVDWLFEAVSHKFHACCHGLHAALEAVAELLPVEPEGISEIEVTTHPRWLTVCNISAPATGLEAKFSYAQVMALAALGYDTARLDTFTDALARDQQVGALRRRVRVTPDETLPETAARVSLTLNGETRDASHDLLTPLPLSTRAAKVRAKAEALLGAQAVARLDSLITENAAPEELGAALQAFCRSGQLDMS